MRGLMRAKAVTILTAFLMVFAMMPLTAFGEGTSDGEGDNGNDNVIYYSLWIGDEQVTSEHLSGEGNVGDKGTWTFDPETNTLTLEDFTYEGEGYARSALNWLDSEKLTILLKGTSTITFSIGSWDPNSSRDITGIYSTGSLEIKDDSVSDGAGQLNVHAKGAASNNSQSYGIAIPWGDLIINGGIVNAIAYDCQYYSYGVFVETGGIIVKGGSLTAVGAECSEEGRSCGIKVNNGKLDITEEAQEVSATGNTEAIYGQVTNNMPGKGWTNVGGTEGEETIDISTAAQALSNDSGDKYKKVHFKKTLTITAKDQTYTYNGQTQGEGDPTYDDPAVIAEKVTVEGLQSSDHLANVTLTGSAKDVGEYPIEVTGYRIEDSEGNDVAENYIVTTIPGKLTIKEGKPAPKPEPKPTPAKVSGTPVTKMTAGKTSMTVAWEKVSGADGYDIFFARCDGKGKTTAKSVKSIEGNSTFTWKKSGLKKGTPYKAYVKAYVMKDGSKQYVKTSPLMHAYTGGGTKNFTNAKSVKVNKTKVSVKAGKTFQLKAKVKKLKKGKKLMPKKHETTVRYLSTDTSIATVSKKGKIRGVKKGTCYVYAYAHNGVFKKVTVTVK